MAFLFGSAVTLRTVDQEDLQRLADWRNDPEIRIRTREFRPLNKVDQAEWFARISGLNRRDFMFVLTAPPSGAPVGLVGLCHWDPRDRTAEISFYVGEKDERQRGLATEGLRLLISYGFGEIGLDRIDAEVYDFNEPCLRLLSKLGFVREGVRRKAVWREGRRCDSVILGLLSEDSQ
jgi:RimJ/RimL family protein N-acetyltransferase